MKRNNRTSTARRAIALACSLVLAAGLLPAAAFAEAGGALSAGPQGNPLAAGSPAGGTLGAGSPQTRKASAPVEVSTPEGLAAIADDLSADYVLTADIDLDGVGWAPIGTADAPFTGTLDGAGHAISNMRVELSDDGVQLAGLFGAADGASFKDITFEGASIEADGGLGVFAGVLVANCTGDMTFESISVSAGSVVEVDAVSFAWVGGIAGFAHADSQTFANCENAASIAVSASKAYAGGMVGMIRGSQSTLSGCRNTGDVRLQGDVHEGYAAGIVGNTVAGSTYDGARMGLISTSSCINTGGVSCDVGDCRVVYLGGIAGYANTLTAQSCGNEGTVHLNAGSSTNGVRAAGIVAYGGSGTLVEDSSNTGGVAVETDTGCYDGGRAGYSHAQAAGIAAEMYVTITYGAINNFYRSEAGLDVARCTNSGDVTAVAGYAEASGIIVSSMGGIEDCTNSGAVTASSSEGSPESEATAAGVVVKAAGGYAYAAPTVRLSNSGSVTAEDAVTANAGGISALRRDVFEDCSNAGAVTSVGKNYSYAGGIAADESSFARCANTGDVRAVETGDMENQSSSTNRCMAGGLTPKTTRKFQFITEPSWNRRWDWGAGEAEDCYNAGSVTAQSVNEKTAYEYLIKVDGEWVPRSAGTPVAGGLFGGSGTAIRCYGAGACTAVNGAKASRAGELAGLGGTYENCYWLESEGQTAIGDPDNPISSGVTALTASAMRRQASFAGFDFGSVWQMPVSGSYRYPVLRGAPTPDPTGPVQPVASSGIVTLDASDASEAANAGLSYTITEDGALTVAAPSNATLAAASPSGEAPAGLRVPAQLLGVDVKSVAIEAIDPMFPHSTTIDESKVNSSILVLYLPNSIASLDVMWLSGLQEVTFEGDGEPTLENVLDYAFKYCPALERFNAGEVDGEWFDCRIPSSVSNLGKSTFAGTAFKSAYIPSGTSSSGDGNESTSSYNTSGILNGSAFYNCSQLRHVRNDSDTWFALVGSDVRSGDDVDYRGTYTAIPAMAFCDCGSLVEFDIPEGITAIGMSAFSGCTSLTSLDLPEGLTTIGAHAFWGTSLSELEVPDSVTYIGGCAIGRTSISSLRLPASLWDGRTLQNFNQDPVNYTEAIASSSPDQTGVGNSGMGGHNLALKNVDFSAYSKSFVPPYMLAWASAVEEYALPKDITQLCMGVFLENLSLRKVASYAQTLDVAGFGQQVGDEGLGWSEAVPSAVSYYNGYASYPKLGGLVFWGFGYQENKLVKFCDDFEFEFVPLAFLGKTGEGYDPVSLFGYTPSANTVVSLSSVTFDYEEGVSQVPEVSVAVEAQAGARALEQGADYEVRYFGADGAELAAEEVVGPGTYTLRVCGDNVSVFGEAEATFRIAEASARIAGSSRESTAAEVALAAFPSGAHHAVLAYGWNFPDALSASALAGGLGAPILLTNSKGAVPECTWEAMELLGTREVWIMGGTPTVPDSTREALAARLGAANVHRVSGSDRCNTAVAASQVLQRRGLASSTCILTNGWKFADAVSASPYAAATRSPVFLTSKAGAIPKTTLRYMTEKDGEGNLLYSRCIVLGDASSVTAAAEAQLKSAGIEVVRLAGKDRYETSAKIAEFELSEGMACSCVALATGANAKGGADALSGGPLMGVLSGPILLVQQAKLPAAQSAWLEANAQAVDSLLVLGGEPSVSESVLEAARAALERGRASAAG